MRTQEEIVERIEDRKGRDVFGFEVDQYVDFLDFEHAKSYLVAGATAKEWDAVRPELTEEVIVSKMSDYMPFAWGKANDCRGLSATRSIMHYLAWIWLAGKGELLEWVEGEFGNRYCYYGKPILEKICETYGWDWRALDNGIRTNVQE